MLIVSYGEFQSEIVTDLRLHVSLTSDRKEWLPERKEAGGGGSVFSTPQINRHQQKRKKKEMELYMFKRRI